MFLLLVLYLQVYAHLFYIAAVLKNIYMYHAADIFINQPM